MAGGGDRSSLGSQVGFKLAVGLSSILAIDTERGLIASAFKYVSGGTLEICGFNGTSNLLVFGPSGATALGFGASITWGYGYPVSDGEVITLENSGKTYFAATGSTVIIAVLRGRGAGISD